MFNLNLTLNDSIQVSPFTPFSISGNDDKLYIGTSNGSILVVVNKLIIRSFACDGCGNVVIQIFFDQFSNIGILCDNPINKMILYNSNETFTNKTLSTLSSPRYIGFDSKGRFVIISFTQIRIYY